MTDHRPDGEPRACQNTDRELWREREGDYYSDSIHVTQQGGIGINHGGRVYVMPLAAWHRLAALPPASAGLEPKCIGAHTWSNDFGDDWTPKIGTPCDCGGKKWGIAVASAGLVAPETPPDAQVHLGSYAGDAILWSAQQPVAPDAQQANEPASAGLVEDIEKRQHWAAAWSDRSRNPKDADDIRVLLNALTAKDRELAEALAERSRWKEEFGLTAQDRHQWRQRAEQAEADLAACQREREALTELIKWTRHTSECKRVAEAGLCSCGLSPACKAVQEARAALETLRTDQEAAP